ncbi:NAD-dependent epimerase/dehydratase family protein [Streptomyces nodosus]|uniref:NAD(P)-dependent oxidoreductase n=1 Tax=Streptomyces nodosus TaxID=40318 RepID=A0A5P2WBD5_9ACTN|nr:NAD(P)-dependent oxidoreductase [Streptomyces nodosus]MBB4795171.1 nucleoside-diphosphate-sugar epimerase [Streptomyces nodosus]QEV42172.1 NAD(P)-dependent oxidoreductase [Streptomyces nodosus]
MRSEHRPVAGLSVVVLGGTGFLGRRIGAACAADGARVHLVSRSAPAVPAPAAGPGVSAVGLDLVTASPREIAAVLAAAGADVVVNAAGRAWQADEAQMAAGNAELVERVLAALAALPGPPVRLVQLGTVHEYGAGAPDAATCEEHEPVPVTPYGRTKLQGTRAVLRAREQGVDGVVLRLANVIGAGVPEGSLFGRVAAHLGAAARADARGEKAAELRLPALRAARDLVDARDATAAVLAAITAPAADVAGQVINVGRGTAVPMRELIHRMITLSGLELPVAEAAEGPGSRTDVAWQCLDVSRARRLLGWRPLRSLDDSLRELLASVLPPEHPLRGTPLGITADASAEEGKRS